ncbi:MAG: hypothetical protein ACRD51_06660 [Candidatus Acidiferrum sp.]
MSSHPLKPKAIASDPHAINGAVNYTYDPMGNRTQIASTLVPVPAGLFNYDANDRFAVGDTVACPERAEGTMTATPFPRAASPTPTTSRTA